MELFRKPIEDERTFKTVIQPIPNSLQERRTNLSSTKLETDKFGNNYRWNKDLPEYDLGRFLPVLHDQHWTDSKNLEISRGANTISFSTSEAIGKMGKPFGDTISSISSCNQCDVEVQATEDHHVLVRGDTNRPRQVQKPFTDTSTLQRPNEPASPFTRRGRECDPAIRGLGTWQLCREQLIGSSSIMETRFADQTSFNNNGNTERQTILQKLPRDLEIQYSQDIPSLLYILKSIYPFNDTSSDVLYDREIDDFVKLYGISNVHPILESDDHYVFWLKDTAGTIYLWSRVTNFMSYIGRDLREALVNYLFHQDKICYVMEYTHEIIPKIEVIQEARELVESCIHIKWEVTKELLKPLKGDGKSKGKKKGKKKKKKH